MSNYSQKLSLKKIIDPIQIGDLLIPTKRLQENHIYLVTKVDEDVVYVSYKNKKSSAYASAIAGWINEGKYIHVPVKK
jgi:hypothetical protein